MENLKNKINLLVINNDVITDLEGIWNNSKTGIGRLFNLLLTIITSIATPLFVIWFVIALLSFLKARKNGEDTGTAVTQLIIPLLGAVLCGVIAGFNLASLL